MSIYNIYNGCEVEEGVYPDHLVTTVKPPATGYFYNGESWQLNQSAVSERLAAVVDEIYTNINERVLNIYEKYTNVYMEYIQREEQSKKWKDSGYAGDAPPQVLAFSVPARMNPVEACELILMQAEQFHAALDFLASLRMMKHEVEVATSVEQARQIEAQTMANIDYVLANLP